MSVVQYTGAAPLQYDSVLGRSWSVKEFATVDASTMAALIASGPFADVSSLYAAPTGPATGGGAWGSITGTIASQTDLYSQFASLAKAWTGTTPALSSGVNPITAGFGSNSFVYTGAGTSPTLDGVNGVNGDIFVFGVGGVATWTVWPKHDPNAVLTVGTFATTSALQTAFPAASNTGSRALVGSSAPYDSYVSNGTAWVRSITDPQLGATGGVAPNGDTVQISGNVTISVANANVATYNGKVLEFTGAFSVTLAAGLPNDFGFAAIPPSSGNASIVSDGTTTLNGATTTITRAAASYVMFAVTQRSTARNAYVVN